MGAAIAGTYYLRKVKDYKPVTKLLVYYLWLVVFVEIIGTYPVYAYFTNYSTLPFLKGTVFERNYWWYNSYAIIKYGVFFIFFIRQLQSAQLRKFLLYLTVFYIITTVLNLIFSGIFFVAYSAYDAIVGTILLILLIFIYYFEVLNSDRILHFYKNIQFYISVGVLFWHLVVTPLFIYSHYFTMQSPSFVALHTAVLMLANIFLYGIIITGFLVCSRRNQQEKLQREKIN